MKSDFLKKENLHHAYCIEGERELITSEILSFFKTEFGIDGHANPDFHLDTFETLSIEEARLLKERQQRKAFGSKKIFIISFSFITREAQNALLKIFEEPTSDTHFFIITRSADILLPTLRSRVVTASHRASNRSLHAIGDFVKKNQAKRLISIKDMIENKDRAQAIGFLNELELYIAEDKRNISFFTSFLQELARLKKFLFNNGASVKLVLEHVALTCPKF